jgi:hypothetical protein
MYLREVEIESNFGLVKSRTVTKKTIQYFDQKTEIEALRPENGKLLSMRLKLDQTQKIFIKKKYKSFFDVISTLGGLFNGLKFGFLLLVLPVREILYYRKLINTNFNVCL